MRANLCDIEDLRDERCHTRSTPPNGSMGDKLIMKRTILSASLVLCLHSATAGTGYYLVSTYPDEGQRSLDFKYWNAKPSGIAPLSSPELGVGYNVNAVWFTEASVAWFHSRAGGTSLSTYEWQNDF